MPIFAKCCCGCPLQCASITIAVLDLLSTLSFVFDLHGADYRPGFVISAISLSIPIIGLVGMLHKMQNCILLYVVCSAFRLLAVVLILLATEVVYEIPAKFQRLFLSVLLALGVDVYFMIVVYSYYQELRDGSNSKESTATTEA